MHGVAIGWSGKLLRWCTAVVVSFVAYGLYYCHIDNYPDSYGWPMYWHDLTDATFTGDFSTSQLFWADTIPHLLWASCTGFCMWSTWCVLTRHVPRILCRETLSSATPLWGTKILLSGIALSVVAIAIWQPYVSPHISSQDLLRANGLESAVPLHLVAIDPTASWAPWYVRAIVTLGVLCGFAHAGHLVASWLGRCSVKWLASDTESRPSSVEFQRCDAKAAKPAMATADHPRPFQFGLRGLLIVTLLGGPVLGYVGPKVYRHVTKKYFPPKETHVPSTEMSGVYFGGINR